MPKIPRDISGRELAKLLRKYNYTLIRETGSHLRLNTNIMGSSHSITIPDHTALKIGTINNILNEVASYLRISKEKLINELFES
jgi:predicted RNA binding protein YcfA (HicA-like mRNA interferase family)